MHLETGDAVFHAGETAFSFYVVKSGRIELRDAAGTTVRSLGPGDHFGRRALLGNRAWKLTAIAVEPTTLIVFGARVLDALMRTSASLRERLLKVATPHDDEGPAA